MITPQEYLNAIEIVTKYHEQNRILLGVTYVNLVDETNIRVAKVVADYFKIELGIVVNVYKMNKAQLKLIDIHKIQNAKNFGRNSKTILIDYLLTL